MYFDIAVERSLLYGIGHILNDEDQPICGCIINWNDAAVVRRADHNSYKLCPVSERHAEEKVRASFGIQPALFETHETSKGY